MNRYKVIVTGEEKSGKTSYINALSGRKFVSEYIPTVGVKKYQIPLLTTMGEAIFDFVECVKDFQCLPEAGSSNILLEFISPDNLEDLATPIDDLGLPNILAYIMVVSQGDLLDTYTLNRLENMPNVSVVSAKTGYNIYGPLNKALLKFPGQPQVIDPISRRKEKLGPFIILTIGKSGAGKSSWLLSLGERPFNPTIRSTTKSKVYEFDLSTNRGDIYFIVYDCPGVEDFTDLNEDTFPCQNLLEKADGIFLLSSINERTPLNFPTTLPTVRVITQGDLAPSTRVPVGVSGRFITSAKNPNEAVNNEVFLEMARKILNDPSLHD